MEVKLDKRYPVAAGIDRCWAVLSDIRAVAACMPGAQITEQIDDTHFKGAVKSKVGPAVMSFGGDIELQGLDAATRSLKMLGKGADKSGSSASMQLTAHLEDDAAAAGHSVLVGVATIMVSGKLAQFGSRLLVPVSDAMLAQFADNFRAAALAVPAAGAAAVPVDVLAAAPADQPPAATPASPTTAPAAQPMPSASPSVSPPVSAPSAHVAQQAQRTPQTPQTSLTPAQTKDLDALALLWAAFKGWFAGLFGKKR